VIADEVDWPRSSPGRDSGRSGRLEWGSLRGWRPAIDDPETPPYALAAMSRELRTLIAVLPGGYDG
jgi:hypothetical protein